MHHRIVIDTDIGTDVDDLWTLAMVPGLTGVDLAAVTLVYGDTDLRARMASSVLAMMGVDVPVHRGRERPLSGKTVVWAGHEGAGVPGIDEASYDPADAVDALIALAAAESGALEVVAIGPLTNIAAAIQRDSAFVQNVKRLVVMGGEFQIGWPEHNFTCDVEATRIVIGSGAPITIVPLDQTLKVAVHEHDIDRIAQAHPIGPLMADQARTFWRWLSGLRAGLPDDRSWAHDPLTLLALAEPGLFTFTRMAVEVQPDGTVTGTPDEASPIEVVTDLDAAGAHRAFMRSLGCSLA